MHLFFSSVLGNTPNTSLSTFSFAQTPAPAAASATASTTPSTKSSTIFSTNLFGNVTSAAVITESADKPKFSFSIPSTNTANTTATTVSVTPSIQPEKKEDTSTPVFNTDSSLSFASLAQTTNDSSAGKDLSKSISGDLSFATLAAKATNPSNDSLFKTDSNLSFASLAQTSSPNVSSSFPANKSSSSSGGFYGLSTKDDFSNLMAKPKTQNGSTASANNTAGENDNENVVEDANYDPHYDPIIALPDEIVVSTGEENESKVFGERAKLYRYDATNKEWKERGVGEFKVLHHPGNNSYRLLLRREQIHKLVLNMGLSSDFQMNPMKQSDKAYCWVGPNYADESNGAVESLSVRFKNGQLAQKFNETVQHCVEQLRSRQDLTPEED